MSETTKKLSEIAVSDVAEYIRLDDDTATAENNTLTMLLSAAKQFIVDYTGRTLDELDTFEDVPIVALVLCQDMYDNRALYVDKSNINKVVENILGMHQVNLL